MAELNFKQIIDRLNAEFLGDNRKLVFWYDDGGDFVEDMQDAELENAKVYFLKPDNQFKTKIFLEREDKTTNYLIYAPFPKPDVKDNHLEDTLLYSKRFYVDRASLLSVDLGIAERYKPTLEKHIKFFASKERTKRFYDLEIENFNDETIVVGLLSAICRTRTYSFEEVVRVILTDGELVDNRFLSEFATYDLLNEFWKLCEQYFGYSDSEPTLEKLVVTMFVTYTDKYIHTDIPKPWKGYISYKSGNIIAFLDNMMNNTLYQNRYDELSYYVADWLNVNSALENLPIEKLVDCDTFLAVDKLIVKWIVGRLLSEDTGAELEKMSIPTICVNRSRMHFGYKTEKIYSLLNYAFSLVLKSNYNCANNFGTIVEEYCKEDYAIDQAYRLFINAYDKLEDATAFEQLKELVENIYTNEYLAKLLPSWNESIKKESDVMSILPMQRDFYKHYIRYAKERVVVIISDAMRYEVGRELFDYMSSNPKCSAKLEAMLGVLPSYTRLGMAALLPHDTLTITDDFKVLADDVLCDNLDGRQTVLQKHCPEGVCVQFDDIKNLKKAELRAIFTGKQVVYIYHNQIDARGDKANTEDEVFVACSEAIEEISDLIRRISTDANSHRFIVTADHGFIYKREKLSESDKIGGVIDKDAFVNRRFIVSKQPISDDGVDSLNMGCILANDDKKYVSFPVSSNVFKVAGGGQNYVHGGSSPQEMLIPVLDIKMERGHVETKPAQIALISMVNKITNLITVMDFVQSEPVSDVVTTAVYKILFISEDNEKISNEVCYIADSSEHDTQKRISRFKFIFKNKKYDRDKQYYLVAYDNNSSAEMFRHPVIMDIAFADDFGF
jgi:uncharacterized protein (TIGR02687 family)